MWPLEVHISTNEGARFGCLPQMGANSQAALARGAFDTPGTCLSCPSSLSPHREEESRQERRVPPGAGKPLGALNPCSGVTVRSWERGHGHCIEVRLKF